MIAATLGKREIDVLRLVAAGLTSKEIGKKLKISPRTVSKHRENLMRKLQIHDMAGLMRIANSLR
ncbi:helix-turn-helix transcriptional regulator [Paraburkholderia caribensis]|uniref:helix-turn-helix transcriptional regulator n=1 Tax=Paraburkholderia caribensis TaxID=75105 RepID=UPI002FFBD533